MADHEQPAGSGPAATPHHGTPALAKSRRAVQTPSPPARESRPWRGGVALYLRARLVGLAILTLATGGLALIGFWQFGRGFENVTGDVLPNLSVANEVTQLVKSIDSDARNLTNLTSLISLGTAKRQLQRNTDLLTQKVEELDSSVVDAEEIAGLRRYHETLDETWLRLHDMIRQRIQANRRRMQLVDWLLEHDLERIDPAGSSDRRTWRSRHTQLRQVRSLLLTALASEDPRQVASLREEYGELMRRVAGSGDQADPVQGLVEELQTLAQGADIEARLDQLRLNLQISQTLTRLAAAISGLFHHAEVIGDQLVRVAEREESSWKRTSQRLSTGLLLLALAYLTGTLLLSIDVERRIVGRLRLLQSVMRSHVAGEQLPVDTTGGDEIGDMGRSFAYFVTAVHDREEALGQACIEADRANKAKGEFLANMSHEIRTPINSIMGLVHLMQQTDLNGDQKDMLSKVLSSARSLLGVVNDILDFSKIDAGKLDIDSVPFSLNEVLEQVTDLVGVKADAKGLRLLTRCPDELPDALVGDPLRLRQVLVNLTDNAIKFTEQGDVVVVVTTVEELGGQVRLRFSVEDTGIGISEDQLEELFDPFTQADGSTTRRHGGTGLGLSISKRLVEMMGGELSVDSSPGRGSVFSFIAVFTRRDAEQGIAQEDPVEPASLPVATGCRILLVEDHELNRDVARRILEIGGFSVDTADNGEQAVEAVRSGDEPYDIVLMDVQMPVMDGHTATRIIRAEPSGRDIPIIALTASAHADEHKRCLASGMNDCLAKPYEPHELSAIVARWVRRGAADHGHRPSDGFPPEPVADLAGAASLPLNLSGIDVAGGLARALNDGPFYRQLLQQFGAANRETPEAVRRAARDGDRGRIRSVAHGIRSTAGTVGARALAEAAEQLEAAADGAPEELARLVETFTQRLREVLASIGAIGAAAPSGPKPAPTPGAVDHDQVTRILCELRSSLESNNLRADRHLVELTDLVGDRVPEQVLSALQQSVWALDFPAALGALFDVSRAIGVDPWGGEDEPPR